MRTEIIPEQYQVAPASPRMMVSSWAGAMQAWEQAGFAATAENYLARSNRWHGTVPPPPTNPQSPWSWFLSPGKMSVWCMATKSSPLHNPKSRLCLPPYLSLSLPLLYHPARFTHFTRTRPRLVHCGVRFSSSAVDSCTPYSLCILSLTRNHPPFLSFSLISAPIEPTTFIP